MPSGFRAGLMQVVEGRARQFKLARRFQADGAVLAGKRDDLPAFLHRLPAIGGERHQEIVYAARLVIGGRAMIGGAVDELFVFGPDTPLFRGLAALLERSEEHTSELQSLMRI